MTEIPRRQSAEQRLEAARAWAESPPQAMTSPSTESAMHLMGDRLQIVIDAAERAADAIRSDAQEQAQRHMIEAQRKADRLTAERVELISQLTDELIDQAAVVKSHSEQMVGALQEALATAAERVGQAESGALEPGGPEGAGSAADAGAGAAQGAGTEEPTEGETEGSDRGESGPARTAEIIEHIQRHAEVVETPTETEHGGADMQAMLLRATQLAVAGGDRESVGAMLRQEFGTDPGPILDQVLPED